MSICDSLSDRHQYRQRCPEASPLPAIARCFEERRIEELFIASWTIGEIWRGVLQTPSGRRRRELESWFLGPAGPQALFGERILAFDDKAAIEWGRMLAEGSAIGRPRSAMDMIVAATAAAHSCVVVTANERHFIGVVEVLNPLHADPADRSG